MSLRLHKGPPPQPPPRRPLLATETRLLVSNRPKGMNTSTPNALFGLFAAALLLAAPASLEAQQVLPPQFGKWGPGNCSGSQSKQAFPQTPVSQEAHRKAIDDEFY